MFYGDPKSGKTTTASNTCKNGNTTGCKYGWLYDRTSTNCTKYGCLNSSGKFIFISGCWTASSRAANSSGALVVFYDGRVTDLDVADDIGCGVRPVITVSKSNLS